MLPQWRLSRRFCSRPTTTVTWIFVLVSGLTGCTPDRPKDPPAAVEPEQPSTPIASMELGGKIFGTTWSVKARGQALDQRSLLEAIEAEFEAINQGMSTWRKDSQISRFNAGAAGSYRFNEQAVEVIKLAFAVAKATGGAFEPTVGPLIRLWGFGAGAQTAAPTPAALAAARAAVGYHKLSWGLDGSLLKPEAAINLDLSAVAKGYAVDRVASLVKAQGAAHGLVEIGGEVVAWGSRPQGGAWKLAVDAPVDNAAPGQRFAAIVKLYNKAMATSGDYRQFRMENGRRVQHIVDPRTGEPVDHGLASVTVVAPDCASADAYATALMVLGVKEGVAWVDSLPRVDALFLERQAKGWRQVRTRNMHKYLIRNPGE